MIGYCGLPGSGKSYGAVANVILNSIKSGRVVYTNLALKLDVIKQDYPDANIHLFTNEDVQQDDQFLINIEHGAVIVIDEAWRFWPSGLAVNRMSEAQKSFFTEHRHRVGKDGYTTEIVLITQDFAQVCIFVRSLISDTYRTVKMSNIGLGNKYRVDVYSGCVTGQNPPKSSRTRKLFGKYKPSVYKYYLSHTKNNTDFESGLESSPDKRNNFFKSGAFFMGIIGLLGMIFAFNYLISTFKSGDGIDYTKHNKDRKQQSEINSQKDSIEDNSTQELKPSTGVVRHTKSNNKTESPKWVLKSVVGHVAIIYSDSGVSRSISINNCELIDFEYFCTVDGEEVTRW